MTIYVSWYGLKYAAGGLGISAVYLKDLPTYVENEIKDIFLHTDKYFSYLDQIKDLYSSKSVFIEYCVDTLTHAEQVVYKTELLVHRLCAEVEVNPYLSEVFIDPKMPLILALDPIRRRGMEDTAGLKLAKCLARRFHVESMGYLQAKYPDFNFTEHRGRLSAAHVERLLRTPPSLCHKDYIDQLLYTALLQGWNGKRRDFYPLCVYLGRPIPSWWAEKLARREGKDFSETKVKLREVFKPEELKSIYANITSLSKIIGHETRRRMQKEQAALEEEQRIQTIIQRLKKYGDHGAI